MLEAIVGCITLCAWAVGLWYYPTCIESAADCCDPRRNDSLIMDEAVAAYVNGDTSSLDILTAKNLEAGESPLLSHTQSRIPIAKALKYF